MPPDFSLDKQNPKSVYELVAEHLRNQILHGKLKPGDQLLPEFDLASQYQVSRSSVRHAIDLLVQEGLVKKIHGKGSFVCDWRHIQRQTGIIALLVPDTRIDLFMNVWQGVETAAKAREFSVVFSYLGEDNHEEKQTFQRLRSQNIAGFIIFPRNYILYDEAIWQLAKENFPFVLIDRMFPALPSAFVGIDNFNAALQAVEYLVGLGHRSIGFAALAELSTTTIHDRFAGYQHALKKHQISYEANWLFQSPSLYASPVYTDEQEAHETAQFRKLLQRRPLPTAIFAINDITAYLIHKAAKAEGIRIPEELALVGFDDDDYARRSDPPLTTILQPFREIGSRAAHLLIDKVRGVGAGAGLEHILLPTRLIIRQSCGEALQKSPILSL